MHLDSYKRKQAVLLLDYRLIQLLITQYKRRSPNASEAIEALVNQQRNDYEAHLKERVDRFFSHWS